MIYCFLLLFLNFLLFFFLLGFLFVSLNVTYYKSHKNSLLRKLSINISSSFKNNNIFLSKSQAFSLVELSVVLIVIGIISAGILKVVSIRDSAQVSNVLSVQYNIRNSIQKFQQIYGYLPGDYHEAYDFNLDSIQNKQINNLTFEEINKLSINGNADHLINNQQLIQRTYGSGSFYYNESLQAWRHLSAANIFDTSYSGTCFSLNECGIPGQNLPSMPGLNKNVGFNLFYPKDQTEYPELFPIVSQLNKKNVLEISSFSNQSSSIIKGLAPAFNPKIAFMIDSKIDDGKPLTGNVIGINSETTSSLCHNKTASTSSSAAIYTSTNNDACIMYFILLEN